MGLHLPRKKIHALPGILIVTILLSLVFSYFYSSSGDFQTSTGITSERGIGHSEKSSCPNVGYTMALSYQDQMTSTVIRVAALQCWAQPYKLHVVEPVVDHSHLVYPFSLNLSKNVIYLGDIFDLDYWNGKRDELSDYKIWPFAPLVRWKSFATCAPRKIILVQVIHAGREDKKSPCTFHNFKKYWEGFFKPLFFKVIQRVCIDLTNYPSINEAQFESMVFKDYVDTTNEFTVVFEEWRGFLNKNNAEKNFIEVIDSPCTVSFTGKPAVENYLKPSKHILSDARAYVDRYMDGNPEYDTIMMRLEHMITISATDAGVSCLNVVREFVERRRHAGTKNFFLATDVGKFGSDVLQTRIGNKPVKLFLQPFLDYIFNGPITLEDYENSFEEVTGIDNSGYVSTLQKTLASKSHCLLMIGGGLFQQHALWWYRQNHNVSEKCVTTVMMC